MSKTGAVSMMSKSTSRILKGFYRRALVVPIALTLLGSVVTPGQAAMDADDVGFYGSVMVQRVVQSAASSMRKGDFGAAQGDYKKAIGMDPQQEDFYFGLYESSHKLQQWDQVALALEELFDRNPKLKDSMLIEYGECLFHLNRYDEAEVVLKKALTKVAEPSLMESRLHRLLEKSIIVHKPEVGTIVAYKEPEKFVRPERTEKLAVEEVDDQKSERALTYLNAFMKCEGVYIAEYKGYEHEGDVTFFRPPQANFKIVEYLKGPPLSRTLPIKYVFHSELGREKPKDWKWSESLMPAKGSKWIIFIDNCVPIAGMFETFHGSFGRQECNEKNLDELHRIIQEHQGQTK